MAPLKYGNNKDNYNRDITHKQPIGKKISYRPYRIIASHYKKQGVWATFFWAAFQKTRPKNA